MSGGGSGMASVVVGAVLPERLQRVHIRPPVKTDRPAVYPDRGTRYQTFSYEEMLEMETVGELATLQPGESAELNESWELHGNVPPVHTEADVDRVILPLLS